MRSPRFTDGPAAVDMAVAVESKLAAARRSSGASCTGASGRVARAKEATTSRAFVARHLRSTCSFSSASSSSSSSSPSYPLYSREHV